jgi:hypothetical protein
MGLVLVEGILLAFRRVRPRLAPVAGSLIVIVIAGGLLVDARPRKPDPRALALVQGFEWIRRNTPCDARFLPNAHTEGAFEALTGRVAVLEGATPFLRPTILAPIVRLLLRARDFFHDPAANASFLRDQDVDFVVVLLAGQVGYKETVGQTDTAALGRVASLQRAFANGGMTIYRVASTVSATAILDPSAFPGFDCRRGPVST